MKQFKEVNIREVLAVITVILYFTVVPFIPLILFGFMVSAPNETTQINNKEENQVDQIKYIGQEGKIGKLNLTVNNIGESDSIRTASGSMEYKTDSGKFAIVNMTIENKGKKAESVMLNEFILIDSNGAEYVSGMIVDTDNEYLNVDTINPNLDVTGNLAFEIPKDSDVSDYKLVYNSFLGSNKDNDEFVLLAPGGKKVTKMVEVEESKKEEVIKKEEPEKKKEDEEEPNDDSYNDYDDGHSDDCYEEDYIYYHDINDGSGTGGSENDQYVSPNIEINLKPKEPNNYDKDVDGYHR
jgi:hypothetical protein